MHETQSEQHDHLAMSHIRPAVEIEAAPVAGSEDIIEGVLEIQGTGWTPTRRMLRVAVAGGDG